MRQHGFRQRSTEAAFCLLRPKQKLRGTQNHRIRSFGRSFGLYRSFCKIQKLLQKPEASGGNTVALTTKFPKFLPKLLQNTEASAKNRSFWWKNWSFGNKITKVSASARKLNASASVHFPPKLLRQKLRPNLLPKLPAEARFGRSLIWCKIKILDYM